ncbi:uncharacterized protein YecE (DUF72 family) [Mucilaginibacter sp. SG538B]|uniref:DUF72 domain-containing protein n=1 Tax=Mucilaginibacter sp. SG538B TaxID=2587021 RepID=UPI00159E1812|nr:DUF72 domain-containing protein [Mucilaginibacter sp. SG538B]NVM66958.1 uncharacterized protein YecE (DUF72 family) [Mucilaginibacter sp. SG538B]
MHFGRNDAEILNFDYHLPADTSPTTALLQKSKNSGNFKAYVGAPKWGYKNWLGGMYPRKTKDAEFLGIYAAHFNAVELSATFYQPQSPDRMFAWKQMVQAVPGFKFCPKFPQSITHMRRFRNVEEQTNEFYTGIAALGEHLGPLFLQLADNFTPNSFNDLKAYLAALPLDVPVFIEARNKNWFAVDEYRSNLFNSLRELNMGAVIADTAGRRDCLHMELTIPHAFIRFVNGGDEQTDRLRLDEWVNRLKVWKEQGLQSLYFFIHAGDAPSLSMYNYFIAKLNRELELTIQIPGQTLG